jgi:hypothetical protein
MKLKTPPMAFSKKIQRMDLFANSFLFAGMVGLLVGITEGGINYPWSNWRVITAIGGGMTASTIFESNIGCLFLHDISAWNRFIWRDLYSSDLFPVN